MEDSQPTTVGEALQTNRPIEVSVLGPLQCVVRGVEVPLAPKLAAVLGVLGLRRGNWTPTSSIIDLVWDESDTPPSATKTLQGNVLRLRRLLGDAIESRRSAYRLNLAVVQLDTIAFEAAAAHVEGLDMRKGPTRVLEVATLGLAMWRGRPFEGTGGMLPAGEIRRLQETHDRIKELHISALIALGRSAEVISPLEAVLAEDPLREQSWAHLMIALHECGRSVDALKAYSRARRVLGETLGVEPGPALRIIEGQILRGERLAPVGAGERDALVPGGDGMGGVARTTSHPSSRPCTRSIHRVQGRQL